MVNVTEPVLLIAFGAVEVTTALTVSASPVLLVPGDVVTAVVVDAGDTVSVVAPELGDRVVLPE
jgi:hypothetical protein